MTWSAVQMVQLTVAVCVMLRLLNTEDELRGMTQTCTARSDEWSQRSSHCTHGQSLQIFQSNSASTNNRKDERQCRWTICNICECMAKLFLKSTSLFCETLFCATTLTTQLTSIYFGQLMLSKKALCHALCCPFYSTLDVKMLHIHSCWTLSLAGKNTHQIQIAAVSSENCNVRM